MKKTTPSFEIGAYVLLTLNYVNDTPFNSIAFYRINYVNSID